LTEDKGQNPAFPLSVKGKRLIHVWCMNIPEEETEEDVKIDMVDIISQTYWENQPEKKIVDKLVYIIYYSVLYCINIYWFILLYIRLYNRLYIIYM
jgi:hypothetical protein